MENPFNMNGSYNGSHSNTSAIPWTEIFARHDSVLSSHLEMLDAVKGQVAADGEAFQAVTSMISKTVQSMNQFKVVRKHMMNKKPTETNTNPFSSNSRQPNSTRTKRPRSDREPESNAPIQNIHNEENSTGDSHSAKRSRSITAYEPFSAEATPRSQSPETEDISQEVQRRLQIQEQRRRKQESAQSDKRKRESMGSNESISPGTTRRKKRAKVGSGEAASTRRESGSGMPRKRLVGGLYGSDSVKAKRPRRAKD